MQGPWAVHLTVPSDKEWADMKQALKAPSSPGLFQCTKLNLTGNGPGDEAMLKVHDT